MVTCPNCGTENPKHAKFCLGCGAALSSERTTATGTRKVVTVLFADVVGSTALGEQLDPEALRSVLARYFAAARTIIERHGGTIEKFIGDAVMAVFGIPQVHEDDALRATRAALELRAAIVRLNEELVARQGLRIEFRIGLNTGEVVAGAGESLVTGDAVNVAARLEQSAAPGEILIGDSTLRLTRDFVRSEPVAPVAAKGKSQALVAHRLIELTTGQPSSEWSDLPFIGRRRELARLIQSFEDAKLERRCYLFTLLGSAGVGKSRLVAEFVNSVAAQAEVVHGRCLPYGEGITYWPIAEIVRTAAHVTESDDASAARQRLAETVAAHPDADRISDLVASAVGLTDESAPRDEQFWGIRRWLEALAGERGLVVIIEDIHWAEATLLDLLEHVADWTRDASILLLCTARPELLETRPTWGGGKVNATTLQLEPLAPELTQELVESLLDKHALPPTLLRRILDTAEGNPLFAEEIVRMLIDDGRFAPAAVGAESAAQTDLEQVRIPTSVQAVIAARLDRLPARERSVVERAAVAGRVFERGAVLALMPEDERAEVPIHLLALVRKELVHPDRPELTVDEAFKFRHLLIRDTAYEALPKQQRAELHERFAKWVEEVTGDRAVEYAEIVGYHYEQAQRYRRELGIEDMRTTDLATRAGELLATAGRRAYLRLDNDAAVKLLLRAVSLLPPGAGRRRLMTPLAVAAMDGRHYDQARRTAAELEAEASEAGDEPQIWKARLLDELTRAWSDPTYSVATAREVAAGAIPVLELEKDSEGLALAYGLAGDTHLAAAEWASAMPMYERGIEHAAAAGDGAQEDHLRGMVVGAAGWGSTPAAAILTIADRELKLSKARQATGHILMIRALGHAFMGSAGPARADIDEAYRIRAEYTPEERIALFTHGVVEHVLGDLEAAAAAYERTDRVLQAAGETGARSSIVGLRALVLFELDRPDAEIVALADQSRDLASQDDAVSQVEWRQALALVAARARRFDEAERLMGEASELADATDFVWLRGTVARDMGRIEQWRGDLEVARQHYSAALALFEQKGDVPDADRLRQLLAGSSGP